MGQLCEKLKEFSLDPPLKMEKINTNHIFEMVRKRNLQLLLKYLRFYYIRGNLSLQNN